MVVILLRSLRGFAQQPNRRGVMLFAVEQRRADRRMRADKGALVTRVTSAPLSARMRRSARRCSTAKSMTPRRLGC